jgi:hypothetical protein
MVVIVDVAAFCSLNVCDRQTLSGCLKRKLH